MSLHAVACSYSHLYAKITDAAKNHQQKSKVATFGIQAKVIVCWHLGFLSMHGLQSVHSLRQTGSQRCNTGTMGPFQ